MKLILIIKIKNISYINLMKKLIIFKSRDTINIYNLFGISLL